MRFQFAVNFIIELLENNSFSIHQDEDNICIEDNKDNTNISISKKKIKSYLIGNSKFYKQYNDINIQNSLIYYRGIRYCAFRLPRFIEIIQNIKKNNETTNK